MLDVWNIVCRFIHAAIREKIEFTKQEIVLANSPKCSDAGMIKKFIALPDSIWKRRIKNLIGTLVLLCFLFVVLRWFEYSQVYHPHRTLEQSGEALGRKWENVFFQAADGVRLNGWYFPADTTSVRRRLVVLLFHGNAGNISHRFDYFEVFLGLGVNVFAFDYRGYGLSGGSPSEEGTYMDAAAACLWLQERGFQPGNIIAFGESLGGAVAAELATRFQLGGIILQSSFTSVPALGAELFPWLPIKLISTIKYDTRSKLPDIKSPVLIMHSRVDSIVGFHHAEKNFAAAHEPKIFCELSGDHNEVLHSEPERYRNGLEAFLKLVESRQ